MRVRIKPGRSALIWNKAGGQLLTENQEGTLVEHDGITVEQQFSKLAMIDITPKKKAVKKAVKKSVKKKAK